MKTINTKADNNRLSEFAISIEEMINVRGGEDAPKPGSVPPPVII